jgi:hypothetical protein
LSLSRNPPGYFERGRFALRLAGNHPVWAMAAFAQAFEQIYLKACLVEAVCHLTAQGLEDRHLGVSTASSPLYGTADEAVKVSQNGIWTDDVAQSAGAPVVPLADEGAFWTNLRRLRRPQVHVCVWDRAMPLYSDENRTRLALVEGAAASHPLLVFEGQVSLAMALLDVHARVRDLAPGVEAETDPVERFRLETELAVLRTHAEAATRLESLTPGGSWYRQARPVMDGLIVRTRKLTARANAVLVV